MKTKRGMAKKGKATEGMADVGMPTDERIQHPTFSEAELEKRGKVIDKKTKSIGAKQRVVEILKKAKANGVGALTQRQIVEATANSDRPLREQHVNNILHGLQREGKLKRYQMMVESSKGVPAELIYNKYTGD